MEGTTLKVSENTRRIAKNTLLLYARMLILMLVSLYTSRVILSALGVDDFGLYNVVGGIVVVLSFLNGTLSTACSRYITVALGKKDINECKEVFSSVLLVNVMLSIVVFLLSETIGLWFLCEKLIIPPHRETAAFWVYQMSIITTIFNIICVPFNAAIIAHERMKAFAYIGLFDAFAKLSIAYLLSKEIRCDRLICYALLLMLLQFIHQLIYTKYCLSKFEETRLHLHWNKNLIKEMVLFISWSAYGSFVSVSFTQGLNILLNLFFGPSVNAARGVSIQVQNAIASFTTNFQTAINPQLIKSYTRENLEDSRKLFLASSKYSFFLLCILGIPIICYASEILCIWLKVVPNYSVSFLRLILLICMFQSLANPVRIVNQAEGNIKKFQLYECTYLLLIVPFSYFALILGANPNSVFIIQLFIEISAQFIRIYIVLPKLRMNVKTYCKDVYGRIIPVLILPLLLYRIVRYLFPETFFYQIILFLLIEVSIILLIYNYGMNKIERYYIRAKIKDTVRRKRE